MVQVVQSCWSEADCRVVGGHTLPGGGTGIPILVGLY